MKVAFFVFIGVIPFKIDRQEASKFLRRERRENSNRYFGIEEFKEGDLKRECYEESCTKSELQEAIENTPMTSIFAQYQTDPCRYFKMCSEDGLSKCSNLDNGKTRLPGFTCKCKPGFAGKLCNIKCDSKGLKKKDELGLPLTIGLNKNSFKSSGSINKNFGPFLASYSTVTAPFMFNVISGGFENVWTSQLNGQKWIEIDLGQSRTIRALTIRGGHYMGNVCTPGRVLIETRNVKTDQPSEDEKISWSGIKKTTQPQEKVLETPVYARYLKLIVQESSATPACLALEVFGFGGTDFAATESCSK